MLTVGNEILDYTGDVATSTADITNLKILINSTISLEDAEMMMTPLPRYEYMHLTLPIILDEIIAKYNLYAILVAKDHRISFILRQGSRPHRMYAPQ
jgi:hypothetical protein